MILELALSRWSLLAVPFLDMIISYGSDSLSPDRFLKRPGTLIVSEWFLHPPSTWQDVSGNDSRVWDCWQSLCSTVTRTNCLFSASAYVALKARPGHIMLDQSENMQQVFCSSFLRFVEVELILLHTRTHTRTHWLFQTCNLFRKCMQKFKCDCE